MKSEEEVGPEAKLTSIRQARTLSAEGHYAISLVTLNRLILQSGTRLGLTGLIAAAIACVCASFFAAYLSGVSLLLCVPLAFICGICLPLILLRAMREGRQRKFEEQLPEAIDTLVRGLRAGHAIPVAVSSVGKNLPDPIGSEFRITSAEMTYGLDLETAMVNLHTRVGQPDLGLISLAISIQSKTGGNLAEILANLSRVIRERFKLRRKAYALAAEGRFSALLLSALPVMIFILVSIVSPHYYHDVWNNAYAKPLLAGGVLWMLFGDYVMYRMVRIRV